MLSMLAHWLSWASEALITVTVLADQPDSALCHHCLVVSTASADAHQPCLRLTQAAISMMTLSVKQRVNLGKLLPGVHAL